MARFAVKTLEFDKVKALLASKTATSLGKAQALAIRTESEFSIVKRLQEETAEALRLLDEGKRFPFGGAHNIVAAVKHAQLGAVLEAETLMTVLRQSLAAYGLAFRGRKTVCVNSWKKSCTIPIIKNISRTRW